MKLLVDSGSTKADWIATDNDGNVLFTTHTLGLNPEVLSREDIIARLNSATEILEIKDQASDIFFYGAGCGTDRMKRFLAQVFQEYFTNATVLVNEDTYAAVYAATKKGDKAIVCILGTGSNCSYFDGEVLHQKVQSLGYIAMDDCSGNRFGRHLIRAYYFNKMPKELALEFETTFDLDADVIKQNFYKEPNPNAYLANFASFLIKHKDTVFCQQFITKEIKVFVENYIMQFEDYKEIPVHFIGSIAFFLKDEIETILNQYGITMGKVVSRPIDGLIEYHVLNA
ncbi:N-acetylglucosamine kinase [Flavobacterium chuncheonense]|uniref:N-acetylglucosamine kinase n=1 Tax=Flavobacterium chuncheonense TaxID=2026653 RepID=A0ABW5YHN7_9FLAO